LAPLFCYYLWQWHGPRSEDSIAEEENVKHTLTLLLFSILFWTVIDMGDSFAAPQAPPGYTYCASNEGYEFYMDADGNTVCFDLAGNPV